MVGCHSVCFEVVCVWLCVTCRGTVGDCRDLAPSPGHRGRRGTEAPGHQGTGAPRHRGTVAPGDRGTGRSCYYCWLRAVAVVA
jgi:hypothetical protein